MLMKTDVNSSQPQIAIARVLVVEDDPTLRGFLKELLSRSTGLAVLGACGTAEEALRSIEAHSPDLMLVDLNLPGMGGIELIRRVRSHHPGIPCVVLTVNEDPMFVWPAIEAGAVGYLVKPCAPARVVEAVHEALMGGVPMSPGIARRVLLKARERISPPEEFPEQPIVLTAMERRVLELLASGRNRKEIAQTLGISIRTVSSHLAGVYQKLHVDSQVRAAVWYAEHASEFKTKPTG